MTVQKDRSHEKIMTHTYRVDRFYQCYRILCYCEYGRERCVYNAVIYLIG